MKNSPLVSLVVFLCLSTGRLLWSDEPEGTEQDRRALEEHFEATIESINTRDIAANRALFTEDGDHINPFGVVSKGPREVGDMIAQAFRDFPDWKCAGRIVETRFLAPDVAVQIREWHALTLPEGWIFPEKSPETVVFIKRDGQWKIIAARPMAPYNAAAQDIPDTIPSDGGFSDPEFEKEVADWPWPPAFADQAVLIDVRGIIHRGNQIADYVETLRKGRTDVQWKLNAARRITADLAITDHGFADTGEWAAPDGTTPEVTYRGRWFGVYRKQGDHWVIESAQAMFPFIRKN
jgi:uncharacterized protein (TIGR02246 family)